MECQLHEYHPALRELSEDEQDRVDSLSNEGDALIRELETELEDGTPEAEAASVRLADIERELDAIEAARTMVDDAVKDQLGTPFLLLATCLAATVGLAAAGTLFGALAAGLRVRDTLLPLLLLPMLAPVLIAATRAFEDALGTVGVNGWAWVNLLLVFAVAYATLTLACASSLLEEA